MSEIEKNFSSGSTLSGEELRRVIHSCTDGLIYVSETDSAIEPLELAYAGDGFLPKEFAAGKRGLPIEEIGFDKFFERLISDREWHGEKEAAQVRGFRKLKRVLRDNLSDLHVYRMGTINIDIFVAGRDRDGNLAGIKTKAIET